MVEFVLGLSRLLQNDYFDSKITNCFTLGDQMEEISNNKEASKLFTKDIDHKNVSVFILTQNVFPQEKAMDMSSLVHEFYTTARLWAMWTVVETDGVWWSAVELCGN